MHLVTTLLTWLQHEAQLADAREQEAAVAGCRQHYHSLSINHLLLLLLMRSSCSTFGMTA